MSPRRSGPAQHRRIIWQAASLLLAYPDHGQDRRLDMVDRAVAVLDAATRLPLSAAVGHLRSTPLIDACSQYADVFDWKRRRTLFLTYYTAGDTRNRGMALLAFSDVYRAAGAVPPARELPDHLAVLLEFAATVDEKSGYELLSRHRTPIDLLHDGLIGVSPIYAGVIGAVSATLPTATAADLKEARRLAMQGPPVESVGLEPFALTIGVRGGSK
ncbi:nitrate reductase molybdenum cofactor assembly chaperone [Nakamurella panacisegetis]|nr:nitrate reductase molybdenum cofactor assembly chaperone [Nakamurella panacisegetis]